VNLKVKRDYAGINEYIIAAVVVILSTWFFSSRYLNRAIASPVANHFWGLENHQMTFEADFQLTLLGKLILA